MTRRVVVGYDGSPAAVAAIAWAAGEARLRGAELVAWTIQDRPSRGAQPTPAGRRHLVGRTRIPPVGYPVSVRHSYGDAATALVAGCTACWVRSAGLAWRMRRARWSWSAHSLSRHHLGAGWSWVLTAPVIPARHCASRLMRPGCVALSWLWCMPCLGTTAGRNCSPPPTSSSSSGAANLSPLNWPRPG
jgi:Universal stress protein family